MEFNSAFKGLNTITTLRLIQVFTLRCQNTSDMLRLFISTDSRAQWQRGLKRGSAPAGIAGSNTDKGIEVCLL